MSLWNHYSGYVDGFYKRINEAPNLVGEPCPRCPENIHSFWQSWIRQGWFDWEQEGYPFWGNLHHAQTWWNYRHLENIRFFHYADMLADPKGEIKRIADFLDIEISDEAFNGYCSAHQPVRDAAKKSGGRPPSHLERGCQHLLFQGDEWPLARGAVCR